ncbi:hypothetical protein [Paenibacillus contaminans]|uniref:Neutral/alkaline non-lysosomal ceramidase N-terminal domain-containing protein n=1 Tax=Paenibacillus contaminans TaxID=450362 RepID=A0A329MKM4_9BACL|nr:hypothetical protein [Paenibacillus contaminans]RAV19263.1 hypothetical protein DQG23_22280 [Paenibacillus contaminans]
MTNSKLLLGKSRIDITPDKDTILGGATISGKIRVDYIKDPLYANTVVFVRNERKMAVITLDLLMITRKYVELIRHELQRRWGFDPDAVMIHATQNHKAPSLGHFKISEDYKGIPKELDWLRGGDERYHPYAVERIISSVEAALDSLEPVKIGCGSGVEGRLAFNRRMVMKDGSISMPSAAGPAAQMSRYVEGPMDPDVGVVAFQGESAPISALLLHYTCHPVHQLGQFFISADWPGALANEMKASYGENCVSVVLNGACGNINPWDPYADQPLNDAAVMGNRLAVSVNRVIGDISFRDDAVLDWKIVHIDIPLRKVNEGELEAARRYIADNPEPGWLNDVFLDDKWVYASGMLDLHEQVERNPIYRYEIQVLRIGEAALVGLPGEPFSEGGLAIKLASPSPYTIIAHNTQFAGYIPTKEAFLRGGYETTTSNWSKFVPDALDRIVEASIETLKQVFE